MKRRPGHVLGQQVDRLQDAGRELFGLFALVDFGGEFLDVATGLVEHLFGLLLHALEGFGRGRLTGGRSLFGFLSGQRSGEHQRTGNKSAENERPFHGGNPF